MAARWVVVGFGEAAAVLMEDVLGPLHPKILLPYARPPSSATEERLRRLGRSAVRDPRVVGDADVVLCAVTPASALEVASLVAPHIAPSALYVDVNSISGTTARRIGQLIADRSGCFVDAAFMGAVPLLRARVPLYLSGTGAAAFAQLVAPLGLDATVISDRAGDASSVKMLWSVMSKGAIALVAETLVAAERSGLRDPILKLLSLEFGRTGSPAMVLRMLESTARSGGRRIEEMTAVRSSLEEVGVAPVMVDATMTWIRMLSQVNDARGATSVDGVLTALARDLPRRS